MYANPSVTRGSSSVAVKVSLCTIQTLQRYMTAYLDCIEVIGVLDTLRDTVRDH
jgi:hypothetical protein